MLSKIAEAFVFSKKSMFASDPTKGNGVLGEGSVVIGALHEKCCLCRAATSIKVASAYVSPLECTA